MECEKSDEVVVAVKHVNKHAEPRTKRTMRFLKGNILKHIEVGKKYGNQTAGYKNDV